MTGAERHGEGQTVTDRSRETQGETDSDRQEQTDTGSMSGGKRSGGGGDRKETKSEKQYLSVG